MDLFDNSFSRSASLPAGSQMSIPYHRGYQHKQDFQTGLKAAPITPPHSPGRSESSDDDDYLLDDDPNPEEVNAMHSQEPLHFPQPLTPAHSDFSAMNVDPTPSEDRPQPPLRLLEDESVHLQPTGPGGIKLSDFEVRGTLGMSSQVPPRFLRLLTKGIQVPAPLVMCYSSGINPLNLDQLNSSL